ncbi:MAG: hypothetical protein JXB19_06535 [Bacteroidales bacterium]|nr:hypothetical protein [Bacteroidales bacterium]
MENSKNYTFLKAVLMITAIVNFIYGIAFFFVPDFLVKISGSDPVFHGWLRWSGGLEIAFAVGALLVALKPINQGIFVTTMALGSLLIGIALLWAWLTMEAGNVWFTALPAILALVISALLWWSRQQAKEILYPKSE